MSTSNPNPSNTSQYGQSTWPNAEEGPQEAAIHQSGSGAHQQPGALQQPSATQQPNTWDRTSNEAAMAPSASASFLWLDEESGDELSVEVRGDEAFFEKLESIGFRRSEATTPGQEGMDLGNREDSSQPIDTNCSSETTSRRSEAARMQARVDVSSKASKSGGDSWGSRRGA